MKRPRRAVLLLDPRSLSPVRESLRGYDVHTVGSWKALGGEARCAPPSTVALVDPFDPETGAGPAPELRTLLRRHPSLPVVALVPLGVERERDVRTLLAWGISEVVDPERDTTPDAALFRFREAHARPLKRRLEAVLPRSLHHQAVALIRAGVEVAVDGGSAAVLASRLDAAPRTVVGWCARNGLPRPRRLLAWMRVLLAAMLMEESGRSVGCVARICGYADAHGLRRAMQAVRGGQTPPRERAFDAAAEAFVAELVLLREQAQQRRRGLAPQEK